LSEIYKFIYYKTKNKININTATIKKVLITGGMGFIGTNLVEFLLGKGIYHITVIDNLYSSKEKFFINANKNNFEFIKDDIVNIKDNKFDFIYNLACPASPPLYQKDEIYTFNTSVIGFSNILNSVTKYNTPILHCSTSEVYGDPLVHPQDESYWGNVNTFGPRSCYDIGKRATETMAYMYKKKFNLNIAIPRIFNTYGPHMDVNDGRVVSNFICQALKNEDITIFGDGTQTRSLCYIGDSLEVFVKCMEKNIFPDTPFNLGNDTEISINKICETVIELTQSKSQIVYLDIPEDDPKRRRPVLDKVNEHFDWTPSTNLVDGLNKTIPYFKDQLGLR
jgi:UDP-glucuronate decarboxylase